MCMQCMMGAMSAGATATGLRAWLVARQPRWLRDRPVSRVAPDRRPCNRAGVVAGTAKSLAWRRATSIDKTAKRAANSRRISPTSMAHARAACTARAPVVRWRSPSARCSR